MVLASSPAKPGVAVPTDSALRSVLQRAKSATVSAYADHETTDPIVTVPPQPGRIVSERRIEPLGVTEWTLSNGARVVIKPTDFQADEILIAGVSVGGVGGLSPDRYYSARLGPLLLERGGAGTIDATELNKLLADKRAAVSAELDDRTESISGPTTLKDLETYFELLWAKTQTPRVDTAAVTALKQQYIAFLRGRVNDPAAAYNDTIGVTMSQGHPLARPVSEEIVRSLDVNVALAAFRDRFADFSDFTFVVVGAVTPDTLRPFVEHWLASLPGGGRHETPHDPGVRPPTGTDREGRAQGRRTQGTDDDPHHRRDAVDA